MTDAPILAHFRQQALDRGIPNEEIDPFWSDHCERARIDGVDPGGRRWMAFLDAIVRSGNAEARALSRAASEQVARSRQAKREEAKRKAAEDAAYAAEALSLPEWLESLRRWADDPDGEMLDAHELRILEAPPPRPQEAPGAWLFAVLSGGAQAPRDAFCPAKVATTGQECGLPVESWSRETRSYRAGRCSDHVAP